ncbi:MAG: AAA family ATPase [Verrucomicrobia bacterium]|nr:AAA family ATPase [Verrucomicrobiota bacterium]
MPFSELIGNEPAKAALLRMLEKRAVPSTLLFSGPDGVGKSLFAKALATLLMGQSHALKLHSGNHPDLHVLRPEGKSGTHPIENIRKLIEEVSLPPFEAPVKVFILEDAHQMLPASSNALLKTLEEPHAHSYFILLSSSPESLLPTITSRCRKVSFFPIPQSQIETLLREKWQKSPEEARRLAFLSHGSLAKASQPPSTARPLLLELLSTPYDYPFLLRTATDLEKACTPEEEETSSQPLTDALLEEIVAWYRDLHLLKEGTGAIELLYHLDSLDRLKAALLHPIPPLERVLEQIATARQSLQRSIKLRTVLEHFFASI